MLVQQGLLCTGLWAHAVLHALPDGALPGHGRFVHIVFGVCCFILCVHSTTTQPEYCICRNRLRTLSGELEFSVGTVDLPVQRRVRLFSQRSSGLQYIQLYADVYPMQRRNVFVARQRVMPSVPRRTEFRSWFLGLLSVSPEFVIFQWRFMCV